MSTAWNTGPESRPFGGRVLRDLRRRDVAKQKVLAPQMPKTDLVGESFKHLIVKTNGFWFGVKNP